MFAWSFCLQVFCRTDAGLWETWGPHLESGGSWNLWAQSGEEGTAQVQRRTRCFLDTCENGQGSATGEWPPAGWRSSGFHRDVWDLPAITGRGVGGGARALWFVSLSHKMSWSGMLSWIIPGLVAYKRQERTVEAAHVRSVPAQVSPGESPLPGLHLVEEI